MIRMMRITTIRRNSYLKRRFVICHLNQDDTPLHIPITHIYLFVYVASGEEGEIFLSGGKPHLVEVLDVTQRSIQMQSAQSQIRLLNKYLKI